MIYLIFICYYCTNSAVNNSKSESIDLTQWFLDLKQNIFLWIILAKACLR